MPAARELRLRTIGLIAPLLLVLAFAVALAVLALTENRLRRQAAQRTLEDYADFAAFIVTSNARQELERRVLYAFGALRRYDPATGQPLPPAAALGQDPAEAGRCAEEGIADPTYVRVTLPERAVDVAGPAIDDELRTWLADTLAALTATPVPHSFRQLFTGRDDPHLFAFTTLRDSTGTALAVYAKEHCIGISGRSVFEFAMAASQALPPSLTGGVPNDSLFSIRITDPQGRVLHASPTQYAAGVAGNPPPSEQWGGMDIVLNLRPEMTSRLVSGTTYGGPPRALFLLLMIIAFGVIAVIQVRRQQELVRLRERFISNVSHELRTPLQQILVFSQLLRMEGLQDTEERQHSIEVVEREARRLIQLVENVLQFSRASRGEDPLVLEDVALAPLACDTITSFQPLAAATGAAIALDEEAQVAVRADANALRRVLLNLLENAVKYGPRDQTVTVTVAARNGRGCLLVDDQGPGIAPGERERVWRPFERLEHAGAGGVTGSGMGLSIVHDLVRRMDGVVAIEDAPGGGARFRVELPASTSE